MMETDVLVIGAGPAGLMCAAECSKNQNHQVFLLDSNEKVGKKLYITGKGRCNVTNSADISDFIEMIMKRFILTAIALLGALAINAQDPDFHIYLSKLLYLRCIYHISFFLICQ